MQGKIHRTASRSLVCIIVTCASVASAVAQGVAPLELRIPDEQVPPGGVIQVKLELTEPKPISTGGGHFTFAGIDELLGVSVQSPNNDAAAVVVRRPGGFNVRLVSSSATLGLLDDYPILTMALRVPASRQIGSRSSLALASGAQFLNPSGVPYPIDFKAGEALIAQVPSIASVSPGSAAVPAGFPISVEGAGFKTGMRVDLKDAEVASVRVVSPSLIRIITERPTVMHGKEIEIRTKTGSRSSYFSYQRTIPVAQSAHPLFAAAEPAFPNRAWLNASLWLPPARPGVVNGVALQNLSDVTATSELELIDGTLPVRQTSVTLPPNTRVVRTLRELFGIDCGGPICTVSLQSTVPQQLLGIVGETAQMVASPVLPGGGSVASVGRNR